MDWKARIYPLDDADARVRWRALWEIAPQRSSFSSPVYVEAAAEAFGLRGEMLCLESGDTVHAGVLVFWRSRGPYREVVIPPFTQYTPLMLREPPTEADVNRRRSALEGLLATLEDRYHVLRFFCPSLMDVRPARWRGWTATPFYTYRLTLRQDDLLAAWSGGTRRLFRTHQGAFRFEERPAAAAALVQLCEAGYHRHGRSLPAEAGRLRHFIDRLIAQGLARLFAVTLPDTDDVQGSVAVLHDGRTAHYWIAGSTPGPAMTVLLGYLLPRLCDDGFRRFDFVGANTPSIAEFKRQFGPELVPYFFLQKITRPELRLLRRLRGS